MSPNKHGKTWGFHEEYNNSENVIISSRCILLRSVWQTTFFSGANVYYFRSEKTPVARDKNSPPWDFFSPDMFFHDCVVHLALHGKECVCRKEIVKVSCVGVFNTSHYGTFLELNSCWHSQINISYHTSPTIAVNEWRPVSTVPPPHKIQTRPTTTNKQTNKQTTPSSTSVCLSVCLYRPLGDPSVQTIRYVLIKKVGSDESSSHDTPTHPSYYMFGDDRQKCRRGPCSSPSLISQTCSHKR